ncbi:MAG: 50S ribosomal protein L11 methyltransferase [Ferruginibacter sp.]
MKIKNYIKLLFSDTEEVQNEQLIALLADIGYTGFEEQGKVLTAFIDEESFNDEKLNSVLSIIPAVYSKSTIEDENWNAQWERSFEPIVVHDFVAIRAAFHQPIKDVKHEIIITPKMSFGTGHHATTYMMIKQMEGMDLEGKTVVDFGTGTGVLAILAEKMGALAIDAIDYDEWSIENANENAATNNCTRINLIQADKISTAATYQIILANINLHVILDNLASIKAVSKKGTFILLSGFIKSDEPAMVKALTEKGIVLINTIQRDGWISVLALVN